MCDTEASPHIVCLVTSNERQRKGITEWKQRRKKIIGFIKYIFNFTFNLILPSSNSWILSPATVTSTPWTDLWKSPRTHVRLCVLKVFISLELVPENVPVSSTSLNTNTYTRTTTTTTAKRDNVEEKKEHVKFFSGCFPLYFRTFGAHFFPSGKYSRQSYSKYMSIICHSWGHAYINVSYIGLGFVPLANKANGTKTNHLQERTEWDSDKDRVG